MRAVSVRIFFACQNAAPAHTYMNVPMRLTVVIVCFLKRTVEYIRNGESRDSKFNWINAALKLLSGFVPEIG